MSAEGGPELHATCPEKKITHNDTELMTIDGMMEGGGRERSGGRGAGWGWMVGGGVQGGVDDTGDRTCFGNVP